MGGVPALRPVSRLGMRLLFDHLAADWDTIRKDPMYVVNFVRGLEQLPARLGARPAPRTILDVACGTGLATGVLLERFARARVTGVDIAPRMVAAAAERFPAAEFLQASGDALPFKNGSFDLVTSLDGFFDVAELSRVCAPGGAIFLAYSNAQVPIRRSLNDLASEAEAAGLRAEWEQTAQGWWLWASAG